MELVGALGVEAPLVNMKMEPKFRERKCGMYLLLINLQGGDVED